MSRWGDIAEWRGPAADNYGDGDTIPLEAADAMADHRGLVVHIAEGTYEGTISWERNGASQISSHFVVGRAGQLAQLVDTHDRPWTQAAGNSAWLSVEGEGFTPASPHYRAGWERLTDAQLLAVARLLARAHQEYGVPLQVATSPTGRGLGHHSMGGTAWGHLDCPGPVIVAQKPAIVALATEIIGGDEDVTPEQMWSIVRAVQEGATVDGYQASTAPTWARPAARHNLADMEARLGAAIAAIGTPTPAALTDAQVQAIADRLSATFDAGLDARVEAAVRRVLRDGVDTPAT
jgi:hypothetical protein